jgi:hypothetical protein
MTRNAQSEIASLNHEIEKLRLELRSATNRADVDFLLSEIQALSRTADCLANFIEFEP